MSANTDPQTMADVTSEGLLATLTGAPAGTTPTRDQEPATGAAAGEQERGTEAESGRQRDERGRFVPRQNPLDELMATPAKAPAEAPHQGAPEAAPAPPQRATPAQQAPAPLSPAAAGGAAAPDDVLARLAEAERLNQTLRGQVTNAARQAEERGKQAARQFYRDEVRREYQALVASGEATPEQVQAALARKEEEWGRADYQQQQQQFGQAKVDLTLQAQQQTVQERTHALYYNAAPLLAQDHGLDVEHVRSIWSDDGERERFQRAAHQTEAAKNFPNSGFNASSLEDYLGTTDHFLRRERELHQAYQAELRRLQRELNRTEADQSGVFRQPTSSRGGAPKTKAPEHMGDITRDTWIETLRRNRPRSA